ncbi:MAG: exodeoxyribonuclease VII small subunit [Phycisphaerales bacterium]|nr:MAG: exodeoxyribonuclease VII small subunit [Phycisphaerales bacterium]
MSKKKLTFEEALEQLESIARQIESGQIGLEDSIARYEEGMGLIRHCREVLARAEMRIQKIQLDDEGRLQAEPMSAGAADEAAAGSEVNAPPDGLQNRAEAVKGPDF